MSLSLKKAKKILKNPPIPKPRPKKVWITVQVPIEFRDEVSKTCDLLNINMSKFLRSKLIELVKAGKLKRKPKDVETKPIKGGKLEAELNGLLQGLD